MSDFSPVDVVIDASTGLIAVVLVISGVAKLRRSDRTLQAMVSLRVPPLVQRRFVAHALPIVELVLGATLVFAPGLSRFAAALATSVMMLVFTVLIVRVVRAGDDVSCECFGALSRDRVDGATLVRNVVLLAASIAAIMVGPSGASLVGSLASGSVAELVLLAVVWAALSAIALLLRRNLDLRAQLRRAEVSSEGRHHHDPAVDATGRRTLTGAPIPEAELVNSVGVTLPLKRLARGRAVLLVFVKAGCGSCADVARAFPGWEARIGANVTLRVATSSRPADVADQYPEYGDRVRYGAHGARDALGVRMLPSAVILGSDGAVASEVAEGYLAISALVNGIEDAMRSLPVVRELNA
ncbi:MauE/DoxX family redox-associated membrane protein [Agromyces bauzanensis]